MKVSCIASTLSLLPTCLAFVPSSSRTPLRTDSSLNSFLRDLFSDRLPDKDDLKKTIVDRFKKSIKQGIIGDFVVPTEEQETTFKNRVEGNFKHMPTKEMTGADTHIVRLCATMAQQCYDLQNDKKDAFILSTKEHETEVIVQDKQGLFRPTNPTFGAAVCGETMILCWRGTSPDGAPMDLVNDIACSPSSSIVWRKHAKTVKIQGAMVSLCNNDIAKYEEKIIAECKKRGIKEIVTTGHSLGGGIGQCAHTVLRAQIQDESSPWSELKDVNVRSLVFSAPMTTVVLDEYTEETEAFMDEIDENSCNFIYSNDPIPRSYGYLTFIEDIVDDALPYVTKALADKAPLPSFLVKRKLDQFVELQEQKVLDNKLFLDLVSVVSEYIHPGKIIYYENTEARPRVLRDMGFGYNGPKKDTFRSVEYKAERKVNPLEEFMGWHQDIIGSPGVGYDDSLLH